MYEAGRGHGLANVMLKYWPNLKEGAGKLFRFWVECRLDLIRHLVQPLIYGAIGTRCADTALANKPTSNT